MSTIRSKVMEAIAVFLDVFLISFMVHLRNQMLIIHAYKCIWFILLQFKKCPVDAGATRRAPYSHVCPHIQYIPEICVI